MPRPRNPIPTYRLHKQSGQAVVTINRNHIRKDILLGQYGSPDSRIEYQRIIAELNSTGLAVMQSKLTGTVLSMNELLLAYLQHAEVYYRTPDGKPTSEVTELRRSLLPVRELYGLIPVTEFGPVALEVIRSWMINNGLCRRLINKRVDRIRRVFKWAVSKGLIPVTVYQSLQTVAGLRAGRTMARESEPVRPVDPEHVVATLPQLGRHVRGMVELQRYTGMRPGEACQLTLAELDRSGAVWLYRPRQHKTAHHGKERVIPLGPRAQSVLQPFLETAQQSPELPVFSPARQREDRYAAMRAARKSRVQPSQINRKKLQPKRVPGTRFETAAYAQAVAKAAKKAGVPHWHPNQLRHLFATEVRKAHGLEAAQVLLGHSRADVTQVYAERDLSLASVVAGQIG